MLTNRRRIERRGPRNGFTMIEIIAVLAVLAILAAVIMRVVGGTVSTGQAAGLAESLDGLRESIYAYRADVRRYPTSLTYLSSQPASATDLCGRNVPTAFLDEWRGPYVAQQIDSGGITVGSSEIQATLEGPASPGIETAGTLTIVVNAVDSLVAAELERAYDDETISSGDYSDGVIRWTNTAPTGDRSGTLRFGIAITGC